MNLVNSLINNKETETINITAGWLSSTNSSNNFVIDNSAINTDILLTPAADSGIYLTASSISPSFSLSDEDIDRIAERVVELLRERNI